MSDHTPVWALQLADKAIARGPSVTRDEIGNPFMAYEITILGKVVFIDIDLANISSSPREFIAREIAAVQSDSGRHDPGRREDLAAARDQREID